MTTELDTIANFDPTEELAAIEKEAKAEEAKLAKDLVELEAKLEAEEKVLEAEAKKTEALDKSVDEPMEGKFEIKEEPKLTKTAIKKLLEKDLVELANSLGIQAKVSDRKSDTLKKVLAHYNL